MHACVHMYLGKGGGLISSSKATWLFKEGVDDNLYSSHVHQQIHDIYAMDGLKVATRITSLGLK